LQNLGGRFARYGNAETVAGDLEREHALFFEIRSVKPVVDWQL